MAVQTEIVPRKSDHIDILEREIEEHWPNVEYRWFARNGGHYWLEVEYNGRKRGVVVPASPSCSHSGLNGRGDLRAVLSSIGAHRILEPKSTREKTHKPKSAREVKAHDGAPDPRTGGLQELIKLNDAGYAALRQWSGVRLKPGVETQAAVDLLQSWHPDVITAAADMIRKYGKESRK